MPKNPIKQKSKEDKFYTKDSVSLHCVNLFKSVIDSSSYNGFIEPSSGGGSFIRAIEMEFPQKTIVAYDIKPEHETAIQKSWFEVNENLCEKVVIGNPPFGSRNKLSKDFIKHAIHLGGKTIAFILPSTFEKKTTQSIFPDDWKLILSERLGRDSFVLNGQPYHVPCTFQVWTVTRNTHNDMRESRKPLPNIDDFRFVKKDEADFFVFGANPRKTLDIEDVMLNNRGYWIKGNAEIVRDRFSKINWADHAKSSVSGGAAWYSKDEIMRIYHNDFSEQPIP